MGYVFISCLLFAAKSTENLIINMHPTVNIAVIIEAHIPFVMLFISGESSFCSKNIIIVESCAILSD